MPGRIYVISGPSGVGKSTIIRHVRERTGRLEYSVSHTSRKPRGHEKDGVDYHFVERAVFRKMIDDNAFVEWAEVYQDLYGTSFKAIENQLRRGFDVIMDVDTQGAGNIRRHLTESVLIYVLPPSLEVLEKRLTGRATDPAKAIELRMEKTFGELKECLRYDYIIMNDDLEEAVGDLQAIIRSKRCENSRMIPEVRKRFESVFRGCQD